MAKISVVMIVQDEEKKIEATLRSVTWADEIVIVDGGSKDKTVEIASRYTSKILTRILKHLLMGLAAMKKEEFI